ncbi:MAG: hypothetical protein P8M50_00790 [Paracoccaceae bacterium]|nr:hypothetical protein [Paracoccaceae bacterium]
MAPYASNGTYHPLDYYVAGMPPIKIRVERFKRSVRGCDNPNPQEVNVHRLTMI